MEDDFVEAEELDTSDFEEVCAIFERYSCKINDL